MLNERMPVHEKKPDSPARRMGSFAVAVLIAGGLMVPSAAFAEVSIDGSELSQGENEVGGGTATLSESMLDMVNVVADTLYSDENLTVNFNGGNELDDVVAVGSATVELNFTGENEIEDVTAGGSANVTVNANGHNEFEDVNAYENANVTVNVTGENDFETIMGYDNANITVRGTSCQRRDIVNLKGDDDLAFLDTGSGDLTIDHVTVNLEAEGAVVGSDMGNVVIDTSKIGKGDGNTYALIGAGGTMIVRESVIDIAGVVWSTNLMTIDHSDVKAVKTDGDEVGKLPYRVYSKTGIELIREKNGEVKKGLLRGDDVWFVDTDDNDGENVDLKADGEPAYYKCADDDSDKSAQAKAMPKTGDGINPFLPTTALAASIVAVAFAARRREEQ